MMGLFKQVIVRHFTGKNVVFDEPINVHHNYVSEEEIDGRPMLVTRKGAIRAGGGDLALIPGSMGTGSYVVRGLGNPASFQSASHGAGRAMSRSAAKLAFAGDDNGAAQIAVQLGTIESRRDAGILDELPAPTRTSTVSSKRRRTLSRSWSTSKHCFVSRGNERHPVADLASQ